LRNVENADNIALPSLPFFSHFALQTEIGNQMIKLIINFPFVNKMTEKRQTIRILQHFATKLRNIANFVMLFQAVVKFLSRSKF
jgi:hypothetical protein